MKIVDITEFYSERGGGIRSHLTTKGHVLCQLGHDHVVIAPGARDERIIAERNGDASACIVRVGGPAMPYDPTYHLLARPDKIRARIADERPDVLEVNSPYLAAGGALAVARKDIGLRTLFWHSDHVDTYLRPALQRALPKRAADAMLAPAWAGFRALAARFDATFAAGRAQADKLREHGFPRVHHVPFGVDKAVFTPSARSEARRRELLGASADAALLVASGRFAVEKRWDVLLDAFVQLRAGGTRAVLALFGDGPERERMQARVRSGPAGDDVRFFGFEKDRARLASAFASADLFVHACPYETFGLSVAEAMACGTPVVVPDEGGARESVDPRSSEIYRSLDTGALLAAMLRMLAVDRGELRARAADVARSVRSVEEHFEEVLGIYAGLLQRRSR